MSPRERGATPPARDRMRQLVQTLLETERELRALISDASDDAEALLETQEALRKSALALRELASTQVAILNAFPAHIALLDTEGTIVVVNQAWRTFAQDNGYVDKSYGIGLNYVAVCDAANGTVPNGGRAIGNGVRAVLSGTRESFSFEYPCHSPTEQRWFQMIATPVDKERLGGAVVIHIDVTERKFAELAAAKAAEEQRLLTVQLAEERERLVAAQAVAKVGSWETDLATMQTTWSDETYRIFGLSPGSSNVTHSTFLDFTHSEDTERVDAAFRASLDSNELWSIEHRIVLGNGDVKHVNERWRVQRDGDGGGRASGTCQDITERKLLETQYLRAQRMEGIGTLAGGIAHDLNNVLSPILLSVGLLKSTIDDPRTLETLTLMELSAERGAQMVSQVLAFARGMEGERVDVWLEHVVRDVAKIASDTFPKNIRIVQRLAPDLATLNADPTQLHQVLLNLLVNARDAMPTGGEITISAENAVIDRQYAAMSVDASVGAHIRIDVVDTGTGIPVEIMDQIFDPFFTTKDYGQGTGLGLATTQSIVRKHGGFMRVQSEVGIGTRFSIYLPAQPQGVSAEAVPATATMPRGQGELVLVVDDETIVREISRQTLEEFGYRVLVASDGSEAISVFVQHQADIAVVLTDMMMPVMDGADMTQVLLRLNPLVPIVCVSGIASDRRLIKAMEAGARAFLPKPYSASTLLSTLRRVLDTPD